MAGLLAGGLALGLATLLQREQLVRLREALTWPAFLAGRTAGVINHALANDLPIGPVLAQAGGVLRWRVFGSGGPQVTLGCGDWLFLTEELRPWPDPDGAMARRAAAVQAIAARLASKGIALHLLLVPDKARVEAGERCGAPYSQQSQARYGAFMARLDGLPVTDLMATYGAVRDPLYYRTDTHWNEEGAALAAAAIASRITAPIARDRPFKTEYDPPAARPGDLLRLMSLDAVPDLLLPLRPRPDIERPAHTVEIDPPPADGDLLGDAPVAEAVLIGSSYSLNGNFLGALEQSLSAPVGQFAEAGGGFWHSAWDYFRSPAFTETPPKLIIWEMPERVVNQPIEPDEAAALAAWTAP